MPEYSLSTPRYPFVTLSERRFAEVVATLRRALAYLPDNSTVECDVKALLEALRHAPSVGQNVTMVRATLIAAGRQIGYDLTVGLAAVDRLEGQIKDLRRQLRESRSVDE